MSHFYTSKNNTKPQGSHVSAGIELLNWEKNRLNVKLLVGIIIFEVTKKLEKNFSPALPLGR